MVDFVVAQRAVQDPGASSLVFRPWCARTLLVRRVHVTVPNSGEIYRDGERLVVHDPWIAHLAHIIDGALPIGRWTIGLDPLIRLIPGIGDLIGGPDLDGHARADRHFILLASLLGATITARGQEPSRARDDSPKKALIEYVQHGVERLKPVRELTIPGRAYFIGLACTLQREDYRKALEKTGTSHAKEMMQEVDIVSHS